MEGCILTTTVAALPSNSDYDVPFDAEIQFGTESFFNIGSPTLIQPPAALNGDYIEYFASLLTNPGSSSVDGSQAVRKNGSDVLTGFQYDNLSQGPVAMRTGPELFATSDNFSFRYRTFGTGGSAIQNLITFGCIVNPHNHLLGLVNAEAVVGTAVNSLTLIPWQVANVMDTAKTFDGTSLFTAPPGAVAAVVAVYGSTNPGSNNTVTYRVDKNGIEVRRTVFATQFRLGWGGNFLVDVAPGDTIGIRLQKDNVLLAGTHVIIEWYGDQPPPP